MVSKPLITVPYYTDCGYICIWLLMCLHVCFVMCVLCCAIHRLDYHTSLKAAYIKKNVSIHHTHMPVSLTLVYVFITFILHPPKL